MLIRLHMHVYRLVSIFVVSIHGFNMTWLTYFGKCYNFIFGFGSTIYMVISADLARGCAYFEFELNICIYGKADM